MVGINNVFFDLFLLRYNDFGWWVVIVVSLLLLLLLLLLLFGVLISKNRFQLVWLINRLFFPRAFIFHCCRLSIFVCCFSWAFIAAVFHVQEKSRLIENNGKSRHCEGGSSRGIVG